MSDLIVNVRQISNYPGLGASNGSETLLVQQGGLGGPYLSLDAATLVSTALSTGAAPFQVGQKLPANAAQGNIYSDALSLPAGENLFWNAYGIAGGAAYTSSGTAGWMGFDQAAGWSFIVAAAGNAGTPIQIPEAVSDVLQLSLAGNLQLPHGTLTVARDPAAALEVATANWVANHTVASFNNRNGQVTLTGQDVYSALGLCDPIATQPWVQNAIACAFQDYLWTCPVVTTWNGRKGQVFLMLTDITTVFFQPGQQPISPTPALTSNDNSIATTAWVTEYIANEFAGSGGNLATQSWVLANTVNSFNGRRGVVTLTAADVFDVGAAGLNSPNFSGVPTAPTAAVGQATGQIATTAFVQMAISANIAGVSSFMGRSGDVVLLNADVVAAGGLTNPSANLTGSPSAPTAAPGTSTPQIANTQFVMAALANSVTSFNTRTGAVVLTTADITGAGGAPLVSPAFSSVPTAPTAAPGTNTVQLATCAFVTAAVTASGGVSSFNGRTGAVDLIGNDISAAGGLVNPSVNLTGVPTAPTAIAGTNTSQIATTQFVAAALGGTVTSFNTRTGAVTLTGADIQTAGGALLAGPAFTGAPTAPTATAGTNTTQLATTQFVMSAILADTTGVTSFNTRTGAVVLTTADITGAGGAPSASPQFTGTPQGPTAAPGTSTTQLATTQFVTTAIAGSGVSSFNGRTGAVSLIANDVSAAGGALLAGPVFTGVPAAPTATGGTNTTQLATCAFVANAIAPLATTASVAATYLPLAGGTINPGNLAIYNPSGNVSLNLARSAGNFNNIFGYSGNPATTGQPRWALSLGDSIAESGSNAGSNFAITNYTDAGVPVNVGFSCLQIARATGNPTFNAGIFTATAPGTQSFSCRFNGSSVLIDLNWTSGAGGTTELYSDATYYVVGESGPATQTTQWRYQFLRSSGDRLWLNWQNNALMRLDPTGNLTIQGTLTQGSDAALKQDIEPAPDVGLDLVRALVPKRFRRKPPEPDPNMVNPPPVPEPKVELGFIAQDIDTLLPEAVGQTGAQEGGTFYLTLDVTALIAVLVNAVKELADRLETLERAPA